jgi:hypothetical protein
MVLARRQPIDHRMSLDYSKPMLRWAKAGLELGIRLELGLSLQ